MKFFQLHFEICLSGFVVFAKHLHIQLCLVAMYRVTRSWNTSDLRATLCKKGRWAQRFVFAEPSLAAVPDDVVDTYIQQLCHRQNEEHVICVGGRLVDRHSTFQHRFGVVGLTCCTD